MKITAILYGPGGELNRRTIKGEELTTYYFELFEGCDWAVGDGDRIEIEVAEDDAPHHWSSQTQRTYQHGEETMYTRDDGVSVLHNHEADRWTAFDAEGHRLDEEDGAEAIIAQVRGLGYADGPDRTDPGFAAEIRAE